VGFQATCGGFRSYGGRGTEDSSGEDGTVGSVLVFGICVVRGSGDFVVGGVNKASEEHLGRLLIATPHHEINLNLISILCKLTTMNLPILYLNSLIFSQGRKG